MPRPSSDTWVATWRSILAVDHLKSFGLGCAFIPEERVNEWYDLATDPRSYRLVHLELEYGLEQQRSEYNAEHLANVRKTRRTSLGVRSGGYKDIFVPVPQGRKLRGVLACGPVRTQRPEFELLREEWQALRGPLAGADEDGFLRYARAALQGHVFEGAAFDALVGWLQVLRSAARWPRWRRTRRSLDVAPRMDLRKLLPEIAMWKVAAELVDRAQNPLWTAGFKGRERALEGIARMPTHVLALLPRDSDDQAQHPVQRLLRVDALQRVTASFAMARVNVLGGRIGDEGAFLLVCSPSPHPERARVQLETLAERVGALVRRRLGFSLAVGVSQRANVGAELPDRYDESVWAVQWALHQRQDFAIYGTRVGRETVGRTEGLYESSRTLCESFGAGRARDTAVDAERVVKDVLRLTGGNVEAARSHFLELLWEMASLVEQRHAAEAITIVEQRERVTDRLERARSLRELTSTFADSVAELARLLEPPRGATVRAKLERARRIIAKEGYRQSLDSRHWPRASDSHVRTLSHVQAHLRYRALRLRAPSAPRAQPQTVARNIAQHRGGEPRRGFQLSVVFSPGVPARRAANAGRLSRRARRAALSSIESRRDPISPGCQAACSFAQIEDARIISGLRQEPADVALQGSGPFRPL